MENPDVEKDPIASLEADLAHHQSIVASLQRQIQELRKHRDGGLEGVENARIEQFTQQTAASSIATAQSSQDTEAVTGNGHTTPRSATESAQEIAWPLTLAEYRRYGRQLLLPSLSLAGQIALKRARVLIVGAGGLGCPAAGYLAGAGVGHLGIVDMDRVEESNLHRQIAHGGRVGWNKAESLRAWCYSINPLIKYTVYPVALTASNALALFSQYTHVLDCSDNAATRYLISDAAVLTGIPLITASALRLDGQLMVLNYPALPPGSINAETGKPKGGPCYRCIFPTPPPAHTVLACEDGGILGPVVGAMGVLQALETIKIIACSAFPATADGTREALPFSPSLLLFSALGTPQFRSVKLRGRKAGCRACGTKGPESVRPLPTHPPTLNDTYAWFCGAGGAVTPQLAAGEVCCATVLAEAMRRDDGKRESGYALIDVRDANQFSLCALPYSLNWSIDAVTRSAPGSTSANNVFPALAALVRDALPQGGTVFVTCRLGNDSKVAVEKLRGMVEVWREGLEEGEERSKWEAVRLVHVSGGLRAWAREVDGTFPVY